MTRKLVSWLLIALMPGAVLAADTDTAVLYGTGSVYLNGEQLSNSSAGTVGDVIQTKDTGAANLNASGSSVVIQSNTIALSKWRPGTRPRQHFAGDGEGNEHLRS